MVNVVPVRRRLCSELVSVAWADNHTHPQRVEGNLEEIGEWSAVILTDQAIARGTEVHIACETNRLIGTVESCTFEDLLGYFVSVRLDPVSRWSEDWFAPKHLLGLDHKLNPNGVFNLVLASGY